FQAEDGIRDRNVTGVQTCALPISTCLVNASYQAVSGSGLAGVEALTKQVAQIGEHNIDLVRSGAALEVEDTEPYVAPIAYNALRSEERRVGKECRAGGATGGCGEE